MHEDYQHTEFRPIPLPPFITPALVSHPYQTINDAQFNIVCPSIENFLQCFRQRIIPVNENLDTQTELRVKTSDRLILNKTFFEDYRLKQSNLHDQLSIESEISYLFSVGCGRCRLWVTAKTCQIFFITTLLVILTGIAIYVPLHFVLFNVSLLLCKIITLL